MAQARIEQRPLFGLPAALGVSVVLHLILVLVSLWAPLARTVAAIQAVDDSVLKFTFDAPAEREADGRPEGVVPVPTPASTAPRPSLEQDPRPEGPPNPTQSVEPPTPAIERAEANPAPPAEAKPEPEHERLQPVAAPDLPSDPAGEYSLPGGADRAEPQRRLNVDEALRDFGELLERAHRQNPPPPGGGDPRNVFVPEIGSFPPTGFGAGNLVFESTDYDWSDYARQIYNAIWRAWHNRLYQTTADFEKWALRNRTAWLDDFVQVRFVIERNGQVTGIAVESPSACLVLDDSATDALAEVILPPLPADFPRDREAVHGRFIARAEVLGMRRHLSELKRRGYF